MAGTSTLQRINSIPKFDGTDFVEWSRSFNDILQIYWPFLSKIVSGLEKTKSISKSREEYTKLRVVMMKRGIISTDNGNLPMLMILMLVIQQMNTCLVYGD